MEGRLAITSNEGAVAAAASDLGIVATSEGACRLEIEKGFLSRLLEDWNTDEVDLHAVYPTGTAARPAARAFVDYLAAEYAQKPDKCGFAAARACVFQESPRSEA
jgi:DNA-binding transcriptional LysR family regulator